MSVDELEETDLAVPDGTPIIEVDANRELGHLRNYSGITQIAAGGIVIATCCPGAYCSCGEAVACQT